MTRLLLTLPLLAACACPPEDRLCDPTLERCVCAGPVGSTPVTARDHDRAPRVAPETDTDDEETDCDRHCEELKEEAGL